MPDRTPLCLPRPHARLYRPAYPNRYRHRAAAASFGESRANLQLQEPDRLLRKL